MSKKAIFLILALIAVGFGFMASKSDATFRANAWSQLFWLTAGTIATTFILDTILERDRTTRRRKADQFAFRTFTASVMSSLLEMVNVEEGHAKKVLASALVNNKEFSAAAKSAVDLVAKVTTVQPAPYDAHYLGVSSRLSSLAHQFIRLFSSSNEEMLEHYQNLERLALKWRYRDVLRAGAMERINSLADDDPEKRKQQAELSRHLDEVRDLVKETALYLSNIAERVAIKPGLPAVN